MPFAAFFRLSVSLPQADVNRHEKSDADHQTFSGGALLRWTEHVINETAFVPVSPASHQTMSDPGDHRPSIAPPRKVSDYRV